MEIQKLPAQLVYHDEGCQLLKSETSLDFHLLSNKPFHIFVPD